MDEQKEQQQEVSRELESALAKAEENLRGWQRAVADFENYKRRDQAYHAELVAFGQEQAISRFLAVAEDVDRLLQHFPEDPDKLLDWKRGLESVRKNLHNSLHDLGIERVSTVGEKFNPDEHEAVEQMTGEEDNIVAEEIAPGYKFKDRLLRPAKVKVYKKNT